MNTAIKRIILSFGAGVVEGSDDRWGQIHRQTSKLIYGSWQLFMDRGLFAGQESQLVLNGKNTQEPILQSLELRIGRLVGQCHVISHPPDFA